MTKLGSAEAPETRRRDGLTAAAVFLFALLAAQAARAQTTIYSWTDDRGVVHYSNSSEPPQDATGAKRWQMRPGAQRTYTAPTGTRIPFEYPDGDPSRRFVRTSLEGSTTQREVLMLVDTGAQMSLVDEGLAEELDLEHLRDATLTGVTGSAKSWIGLLPRLRVGGEDVRDLPVMVGPRSGLLLLGMDVIHRLKLTVGQTGLESD